MEYQVSVFLENKIGHFGRITSVLKENDINILNMNLNHTANGWGILNLIVKEAEKTCLILRKAGISATLRKIIAVEMEDAPGGLDKVLHKISDAGVNFTNAYGLVVQPGKKAFLIIDAEQMEDITDKLKSTGLSLAEDDFMNYLQN
jgi:hypothetical protein